MSKDGFGWSTKMTRYKKSVVGRVDDIEMRVQPGLYPVKSFF